jgi:prolyl 4-hydroxylase
METFIREYFISDTSICDAMVELFKKALEAKLVLPGTVGAQGLVEPRLKRSMDLSFATAEKHWNLAEFRFDAYMREVAGFVNRYLDETRINEHGGTFMLRHPPQIQWYRPGDGFYAYHIDGAHGQCDRALVFTTYLNTVTEGGGTEFYHQKQVVSAQKGKTAIFPAALTHVHRGVVSPSQDKYLVTGWLSWT